MDLTCEIIVDAPVDAAFTYYSDQDRLQEWVPGSGILEFTPITPPPKKPGSRYRMVYRSFGMTFRLIAELKKLEKNRLSVMEQISGDYEFFHYEMHFSPVGPDRTMLTMYIHAGFPWGQLGEFIGWLSKPFARRNIEASLRRFKIGAEVLSRQTLTTASALSGR